uniref:Uncharacterized protein n=1 Tax=Anguilla anguilla TaxID=7936 RepID=A0A0E9SRR8_ANGAN
MNNKKAREKRKYSIPLFTPTLMADFFVSGRA